VGCYRKGRRPRTRLHHRSRHEHGGFRTRHRVYQVCSGRRSFWRRAACRLSLCCVWRQRPSAHGEPCRAAARHARRVGAPRGGALALSWLWASRARAAAGGAARKGRRRRCGLCHGCPGGPSRRRRGVSDEHRSCGARGVAYRQDLDARHRSARARPRASVPAPSAPSTARRAVKRAASALVGGLVGARAVVRHGRHDGHAA